MASFISSALSWLVVAIGPLAKKLLVALGIGTITYTGFDAAFGALRDQVISNYGSMPANVAGIISLTGLGQALGIILGAMAGRVGLVALSHFAKVL